jgi:hypothetical protein
MSNSIEKFKQKILVARAREENIVPVDRDSVLYICDQKQCKNCSYPTCKHTEDVNHAVNFTKEEIGHWEKEK